MINAGKIFNKLKGEENPRGRVSLYLNKDVLALFKGICINEGFKPSPVLEELMREFINSTGSEEHGVDQDLIELINQVDDQEILDSVKRTLKAHLKIKKNKGKKSKNKGKEKIA